MNSLPDAGLQTAGVSAPENFSFAKPELNAEEMSAAKQAIQTATSESIIERCQEYLLLLDVHRNELYKFRGSPEINRRLKSVLTTEAVEGLRKQIRSSVEKITRERNQVESLLKSFTIISGYEALETLNQSCYKGFEDWELKAGGVRSDGGGSKAEQISIQDAVTAASLLRRTEYLTAQTDNRQADLAKQIWKEMKDVRFNRI